MIAMTAKREVQMTKHTQVGPPAMVGNYRVRVVSDSEHPHFLPKATWEDPNRDSANSFFSSGPPNLETILVTKHGVSLEHDRQEYYIPSDTLEAVLKVAGWRCSVRKVNSC